MGFTQAVKTCFSKYFTFSGRAARPEYWWFALFIIIVSLVLALIDAMIFGTDQATGETRTVLAGIFQLAILCPALAVGWRRLHDSGRPGWYLILPMLVSVAFMIAMFTGIFAFGAAENAGTDADALQVPAAILGVAGIAIFLIVQLVLAILMIWWMTRPSDEAANQYGPKPV